MVLWAAKVEPPSDSHCTGCGARIRIKPRDNDWGVIEFDWTPGLNQQTLGSGG
jgi:hypothetical protein